jgi:predicted DNA-binding mobile mystery protein A
MRYRTTETLKGLQRRIERDEIDGLFHEYPMLRVALQPARGGWLRTIRSALGMTAAQLGRRIGVSQNAVSEAERAETEGRITLNTLRKMADGLNCDLSYALVPRGGLGMMVHNAAQLQATRLVAEAAQGMALESQATDDQAQSTEADAVREGLIAAGASAIWD